MKWNVSFGLISVVSELVAVTNGGDPINGEERYPPTLMEEPPDVFAGIILLLFLWFLIVLAVLVISVDLKYCYYYSPYSPDILLTSESLVRFIILCELLLLWLLGILFPTGIYSTSKGFLPSDTKNTVEEFVPL